MTIPPQAIRTLKLLSQPSSMMGYIGMAGLLHLTAPQFNAVAALIAAAASAALVFINDGTNLPGK